MSVFVGGGPAKVMMSYPMARLRMAMDQELDLSPSARGELFEANERCLADLELVERRAKGENTNGLIPLR